MKISRLNFTEFTFLKHGDNKHRTLWTDKVTIGIAYEYNGENKAIELFIKQGFLFDGASRPKLVNWVIKRWYKQPIKNIPALVHDAIFAFGSDYSDKQPMDFKEANKLFEALLVHCKSTNKFKARLAYLGVASPIGKLCWRNENKFDAVNERRTKWTWL